MTKEIAIIVGALIGASLGLISAYISAKISSRIALQKRSDDLFAIALEFMGGGTQRRNLGIAAITLYWQAYPQYKKLCSEMLIGSAIYLLTESKQKDASLEIFNLYRIMALLKDISSEIQDREGYNRLEKTVKERFLNYSPKPTRGLWIDKSDLENWQKL